MIRWCLLVSALLLGIVSAMPSAEIDPGRPPTDRLRTGDIVFLHGRSLRSSVVRLLERYSTDYSHVGLIVVEQGVPYVVHADPASGHVVRQRWDLVLAPARVSGGAVYRVRGADRRAAMVAGLTALAYERAAVPFDYDFDLRTGDSLYCTELVLRAYRSAGVDVEADAETLHPQLLPSHLLETRQLEEVVRF